MEPENQPLEKKIPTLETIIVRFHVKLWGYHSRNGFLERASLCHRQGRLKNVLRIYRVHVFFAEKLGWSILTAVFHVLFNTG